MNASDQRLDGNYTIKLARNLIFKSYQEAGIVGRPLEYFEKSSMVADLGEVPSGWNEGLFRYLDETISFLNTTEYCFLTAAALNKHNKYSSIIIIIYQMKSNAAAVRLLSSHGLDSQARLSLRALYENGIALCRALIDEEFRFNFSKVMSASEANKFWHQYMSKSKSEKFLQSYNASGLAACPLVAGDTFKDIYERLGVSAHPNYIFSSFEYIESFSSDSNLDAMFNGSKSATEFVLTSACHVVLSVLSFLSHNNPEVGLKTRWKMKTNIFKELECVEDVLACIGKISGVMTLMLMKWSNRQKGDFDPSVHF